MANETSTIVRMGSHLHELRAADDDWSGIVARKERKKRQNRLNQRAKRRREAIKAAPKTVSSYGHLRFRLLQPNPPAVLENRDITDCIDAAKNDKNDSQTSSQTTQAAYSLIQAPHPQRPAALGSASSSTLTHQHNTKCLDNTSVLENTDLYFPLPVDGLLHLIHLNVYRGLTSNKTILNLLSTFVRVAEISKAPCTSLCSGLSVVGFTQSTLPPALFPTPVQQTIGHPSWIDMFPCPQFRDNLISRYEVFDHLEFCDDIFGEIFSTNGQSLPGSTLDVSLSSEEKDPLTQVEPETVKHSWRYCPAGSSYLLPYNDDSELTSDRKGLIIWGDPWRLENWEVTPGFIRKWPWVVQQCDDLIKISNGWRAKRGEEMIQKVDASFGDHSMPIAV